MDLSIGAGGGVDTFAVQIAKSFGARADFEVTNFKSIAEISKIFKKILFRKN